MDVGPTCQPHIFSLLLPSFLIFPLLLPNASSRPATALPPVAWLPRASAEPPPTSPAAAPEPRRRAPPSPSPAHLLARAVAATRPPLPRVRRRHRASSSSRAPPWSGAVPRGDAGVRLAPNLLRAAGLDPAPATRSITKISVNSSPHLARHALEAHATAVLLGGFDHESLYLDGSLSSLLDPTAFRQERYAQYRDMRGMDPGELLGVLPTCAFGRYAAAKFASLLPPRVEEAVLGGEHRAAGGAHPRTPFYGEFLRAAKAVWLLHLLAFALEPPPSHFEAGRGAEFHPEYMESVVAAGRGASAGTAGMVVGVYTACPPAAVSCAASVV